MVGAPLQQIQPSNNGSRQPTGAIFSCSLRDDECNVLNHTSFYTFDGKNNLHKLAIYNVNHVIVNMKEQSLQ